MNEEIYAQYPSKIDIREFKINGVVYITTFKASNYTKHELHSLYKRRWEVELHLNSIKTIMGMDSVACKTPEMVRKEIGVYLLAYNIIRSLIVQACLTHEVLLGQVSFKATLQLLNQFTPHLSALSHKRRERRYQQMLLLIVQHRVGNRPGRVEPRAIRQRSRAYPTLKNPRKIEQMKLLKQKEKRIKNDDAA